MARTTRGEQDCLPRGFSAEDLKLAKWFLDIVAPLYPGALHSHTAKIAVSDAKGGRTLVSLSTLFHEQWPHVQLVDILTALAHVGFITPAQQTVEPATSAESRGYSFRLVPPGGSAKPRSGQKVRGGGRKRHRKVG